MIVHLNQENFASYTTDGNAPILVDFWASWCGPCKMLAPVLEELDQEGNNFVIGKVNVDEELSLANRFGIMSIPTLVLFKEGKKVAQAVGYQTKEQLKLWLESQGV